jgi:DNA-binding transcriptional LysR family regulator
MSTIRSAREVLTPASLAMLERIVVLGSFAAAAREAGLVPSALTYRVRRIEEALDVLLFDRRSREARLTEAGRELLREGRRLLGEIDAVANHVRRLATGWEAQFTIAVDSIIEQNTVMELCEAFHALDPPTRLRIRAETLSGTLAALASGRADIALGVNADAITDAGLQARTLGTLRFVFAVAPHHPLAAAPEPIPDDVISRHRAVAVADTVREGSGVTVGLLAGQDVFTVPDMASKIDAQLRGIGAGFLPLCRAQPYVDTGRLVVKRVERPERRTQISYAWRKTSAPTRGKALAWWLKQLERPATRAALLERAGVGRA